MRKKDLKIIQNNIGNGKVKILLGAYCSQVKEFLLKIIPTLFNDKKKIFVINDDFPKDYLFKYLLDNIQDNALFLIHKLPGYLNVEAIINLFAGNKGCDLIATSNVDLVREYGEDSTNIRGRIKYIYYPSVIYDDFIDSGEKDVIAFLKKTKTNVFAEISNYKYCRIAEMIMNEINKQIGYPLSISTIYGNIKVDVSLNTFTSIVNYLMKHGFLYVVNKMDLNKNDVVNNYVYFYPTDISSIVRADIKDDYIEDKVLETFAIAKMIQDNNIVWKAVYRNSDNDPYNPLLNTLLVMGENKKMFVKIYFKNNEQSLDRYLKYKSLYPKYILVKDKVERAMDKNGVTYINVIDYLENGIK